MTALFIERYFDALLWLLSFTDKMVLTLSLVLGFTGCLYTFILVCAYFDSGEPYPPRRREWVVAVLSGPVLFFLIALPWFAIEKGAV